MHNSLVYTIIPNEINDNFRKIEITKVNLRKSRKSEYTNNHMIK